MSASADSVVLHCSSSCFEKEMCCFEKEISLRYDRLCSVLTAKCFIQARLLSPLRRVITEVFRRYTARINQSCDNCHHASACTTNGGDGITGRSYGNAANAANNICISIKGIIDLVCIENKGGEAKVLRFNMHAVLA